MIDFYEINSRLNCILGTDGPIDVDHWPLLSAELTHLERQGDHLQASLLRLEFARRLHGSQGPSVTDFCRELVHSAAHLDKIRDLEEEFVHHVCVSLYSLRDYSGLAVFLRKHGPTAGEVRERLSRVAYLADFATLNLILQSKNLIDSSEAWYESFLESRYPVRFVAIGPEGIDAGFLEGITPNETVRHKVIEAIENERGRS